MLLWIVYSLNGSTDWLCCLCISLALCISYCSYSVILVVQMFWKFPPVTFPECTLELGNAAEGKKAEVQAWLSEKARKGVAKLFCAVIFSWSFLIYKVTAEFFDKRHRKLTFVPLWPSTSMLCAICAPLSAMFILSEVHVWQLTTTDDHENMHA